MLRDAAYGGVSKGRLEGRDDESFFGAFGMSSTARALRGCHVAVVDRADAR
jgi:hypothetical protein